MISTRFSPSSPVGRSDHQRDQEGAEDDVPRRLGLGEHHVLPHERREVEHGHEQRDARPAVQSVKTSASDDERDVRDGRHPRGRRRRNDHPVSPRSPQRRRPSPPLPLTHASSIAPAIAWTTSPKTSVPPTTTASLTENRKTATTPSDDHGVEEHARVARVAEQLEQDPDQHRAEHDARPGCRSRRG